MALSALASGPAAAQGKQLTLCWAAWDPANALVELGKDFTKQSGIEMKYEFVPWTSYADRFLNELNSHGKLCDLIIVTASGSAARRRTSGTSSSTTLRQGEHLHGRFRPGDR